MPVYFSNALMYIIKSLIAIEKYLLKNDSEKFSQDDMLGVITMRK